MSNEKFIHDREPGHPNHAGRHSIRRAFESNMARLLEWRRERVLTHDLGEDHPLPPEIEEGLVPPQYREGVETEIVNFFVPTLADRIFTIREQIRQELRNGTGE